MLLEACRRVLRFPTVADKSFLIHIGDRTVGGLIVRDQNVGPWQVPVSDVAVTTLDFEGYRGEAMAMGERTPVAVTSPGSRRAARRGRSRDQYRGGRRAVARPGAPVGQLDGGQRRCG